MASEPTVPAYLCALADAITAVKGWHPGARRYRNNNPGDLAYGDLGLDAQGRGRFSSYARGRAALLHDLELTIARYPQWSVWVLVAFYGWPLGVGQELDSYIKDVALALEVPKELSVGQLGGWWEEHGMTWEPMKFEEEEQQG